MPFDPLKYDRTAIGAHAYSDEKDKKFSDWLKEKDGSLLSRTYKPEKPLPFLTTSSYLIDAFYYARNLFAGRRVKTASLIIGSMMIGAIVGAVLGTFLLPVIGTAIGGVVGGAVLSIVTGLGVAGLTLLGAGLGRFLGKKLSKYFFRPEKRYEISSRKADRIKKHLGLNIEDAEIINAYLRNRRDTIKNVDGGALYEEQIALYNLRKLIVDKPNEQRIDLVVSFFENELDLLTKKTKSIEVKRDIDVVLYILRSFTKPETRTMGAFTPAEKTRLETLCDQHANPPRHPPAHSVDPASPRSAPYPSVSSNSSPRSSSSFVEDFNASGATVSALQAHLNQHRIPNSSSKHSLTYTVEGVAVRAEDKEDKLSFSTAEKLSVEDFRKIAQKIAKDVIDIAKPGATINLTVAATPEKQKILYAAFQEALGEPPRKSLHFFVNDEIKGEIDKRKGKEKERNHSPKGG